MFESVDIISVVSKWSGTIFPDERGHATFVCQSNETMQFGSCESNNGNNHNDDDNHKSKRITSS